MQEKRTGRLTPRNLKSIQKITAWGRAHGRFRKQVVVLLVAALLWFYLLGALRSLFLRHRRHFLWVAVPAAVLVLLSAVLWTLATRRPDGTRAALSSPGPDVNPAVSGARPEAPEGQERETGADRITEEEAGEFCVSELAGSAEEIPDMSRLREQNPDCAGWLLAADTKISYPVMRRPGDEEYYLYRDFYGKKDRYGCLILDDDSALEREGANLIIHGHNTSDGTMFGTLKKYRKKAYGMEHSLFLLGTQEGTRTYQLMAVFDSQVYYEDEEVFKYYKYFGGTKEEFLQFYENSKALSLYDTGVEAVYGDEFLTLSTCAYHVENGRFVVVAKRIY